MPLKDSGTGSVISSSSANAVAIILRLSSVIPRLKIAMTVNGHISFNNPPSTPSSYWSLRIDITSLVSDIL